MYEQLNTNGYSIKLKREGSLHLWRLPRFGCNFYRRFDHDLKPLVDKLPLISLRFRRLSPLLQRSGLRFLLRFYQRFHWPSFDVFLWWIIPFSLLCWVFSASKEMSEGWEWVLVRYRLKQSLCFRLLEKNCKQIQAWSGKTAIKSSRNGSEITLKSNLKS